MNTEPQKEGLLSEHLSGVGTVTRAMVHERSRELARINGRSSQEVTKSDWEQAKRELTGGSEMTDEELALDAAGEPDRWNPVPGTKGHQTPENPSADEDEEGRSIAERLVDGGVLEAEHDQMLQASQEPEDEDAH
jgi:hypothetical protein